MKVKKTIEDGKGNVVEEYEIDIPVREPTELEIRLHALELKAGITKQDKEEAASLLRGK